MLKKPQQTGCGNQNGNPQQALKDKVVINSGCSRHMTGNISLLLDFKEFNGGYVAFGGNTKGRNILGKGKIKTGKLDFDDVYFVKELKFNLFNVSQMHDKKNSVLFTDTECVVLFSNFKLPDENHVLLRVPRENSMYNVDLKNVVPLRDLTCLFVKATLDESNLWHRRLGHINFKTMNKLVKGNLVRGLPSKIFENNHTYVACQKGKQHRASCFMRPFGCLVTILNTLDSLGKFDGKADEGFLLGYSVNSKAFRVFNSRTKIVQETLHINFLVNKPNVAGIGPKWQFDIDTLTKSMNYQPVVAGNQPNDNAVIKENLDAGKDVKETVFAQQYVLLPLRYTGLQDPQNTDANVTLLPLMLKRMRMMFMFLQMEVTRLIIRNMMKRLKDMIKDRVLVNAVSAPVNVASLNPTISTNSFNTASPSTDAVSLNFGIVRKSSFVDPFQYHDDLDMPKLEEFIYLDKEENVYVDDIIFKSTNKELCKAFERLMKDKFQMSSMGELTFFLGLQVKQKDDRIFISQDKYVAEILRKFGFTDVKSANIPIKTEKPLLKDPNDEDVDVNIYSDYVGASLDRKSTIGGCQFLGCRLISWRCKKQTVVATTSTEAEYVATASSCAQVLWI
nr:putative ribonuclease H-like domain-containing protein [Tanacetum cinerariifolium]